MIRPLAALLLLPFSLLTSCLAASPAPRFLEKKFATVSGQQMAYVDVGTGDPIVFLHGNPTSSYLWRHVLPLLEPHGRLIAPDLIGMGSSAKLAPGSPDRYTFLSHSNYLSQLLEQLGVKRNVTLVIHDWGSALGFLWAYQHRFDPAAVKAIVFLESIVAPITSDLFPPAFADFFAALRASPSGEQLILQDNFFIETVLPASILRNFTEEELNVYRRPYLTPGEDRRPMLTWPRQVPIDGAPADVVRIVADYSEWLGTTRIPKLFIRGVPGSLLPEGSPLVDLVRSWPNLTEVAVPGIHFLQEDSPREIGEAISDLLDGL